MTGVHRLPVDRLQPLAPTFDGGDELVWIRGSGEGFRLIVGLVEDVVDAGLEVNDGRAIHENSAAGQAGTGGS